MVSISGKSFSRIIIVIAIAIVGCTAQSEPQEQQVSDVSIEVVKPEPEPLLPADTTNNAAKATSPAPAEEQHAAPVHLKEVEGNWERTDAPYQLRITELLVNGTVKAGYFNPKQINVGKASWGNANGVINVYVEMRDVNYPGSSYTLVYLPAQDMLAGKYFQAVEGVTYDVAFQRIK